MEIKGDKFITSITKHDTFFLLFFHPTVFIMKNSNIWKVEHMMWYTQHLSLTDSNLPYRLYIFFP